MNESLPLDLPYVADVLATAIVAVLAVCAAYTWCDITRKLRVWRSGSGAYRTLSGAIANWVAIAIIFLWVVTYLTLPLLEILWAM